MELDIKIEKLDPADKEIIHKIAQWYFDEWDTPIEKTVHRLTNQPDENTIFQLVLSSNNNIVATGGLCNKVNIYNIHEHLKKYKPWIGLLYTQKNFRNKGLGTRILTKMEHCAKERGFDKIYLYTFTAESLYERCGWKTIDELSYKNHNTVIMEKAL